MKISRIRKTRTNSLTPSRTIQLRGYKRPSACTLEPVNFILIILTKVFISVFSIMQCDVNGRPFSVVWYFSTWSSNRFHQCYNNWSWFTAYFGVNAQFCLKQQWNLLTIFSRNIRMAKDCRKNMHSRINQHFST